MKTKTRNILAGAAVAVLLGGAFGGIATLGNHKAVAEGQESALDLLNGFTCPGASVYIAGAGESIAKQMRFVLNLDAAQAAYADEAHTAGVVVLPYDLYRKNNLSELTKDNEIASKVDVKWEKQENGSYTSYAYLDATLIPAGQENRTLVARGYIEDGTNVYYTEEVKASMAYVAWKNIGMQGGAYDTQLKEYMGEYTLTYGAGENEKIGGLYYGDKFDTKLPETVGGVAVEKWYWDEAKTQEILTADYATGSMTIYYELEKFDVTGTISCADGIDLTKVKVYVNGEDTGATVSESGSFSVQLPADTYDFVFETEGYIAYADGVEVSATTEAISATLKKNTYAIGDYGALKSNTNPTFNENGVYTINGQNQMIIFPHTATSNSFTYEVTVNDINRSDRDSKIGICITDGNYRLAIGLSEDWQVLVSLSQDSNEATHNYYGLGGKQGVNGVKLKFVVTKQDIKFYVNNTLRFTFTSEEITSTGISALTDSWVKDTLTDAYKNGIAGFFAENAKIAVGIMSGWKDSVTATYTCSIAKFYAVSGTISPVDGVDLTATTLTVDGISTPISVQGNGSYSVLIAEGKHTLVFANGKYGATKEITVVNGENIADVQLKDGTWLAGKYGNVASNNTPELNENGTYTVSGQKQLLLFPNTATTGAFTYEVTLSDIERDRRDKSVGIALSDGAHYLAVGLYQWETIVVESDGKVTYFDSTAHSQYWRGTMKFVVASDKIELWVNDGSDNSADVLYFTFTSSGITLADGVTNRRLENPGWEDSLTGVYQENMKGFFGENAQLVCGISHGWNGSTTATYTCKLQKN